VKNKNIFSFVRFLVGVLFLFFRLLTVKSVECDIWALLFVTPLLYYLLCLEIRRIIEPLLLFPLTPREREKKIFSPLSSQLQTPDAERKKKKKGKPISSGINFILLFSSASLKSQNCDYTSYIYINK